MTKDCFERLGLPRRFSVDPAVVEREYLTRSRDLHPDFHGRGTPEEQRASLDQTAALNEAYLTIKDWFRRAEYLLGLYGGPSAQQEKNLDQEFLMEMMELRERIEEARTTLCSATAAIEDDLAERESAFRHEITARFEQAESATGADRIGLIEVRKSLNAVKTIRSLIRDLHDDV